MNSKWFEGYDDKEARKKQLAAYKTAFSELKVVLERMRPQRPQGGFDNSNWALHRAHYEGQLDMLDKVLKTLEV